MKAKIKIGKKKELERFIEKVKNSKCFEILEGGSSINVIREKMKKDLSKWHKKRT